MILKLLLLESFEIFSDHMFKGGRGAGVGPDIRYPDTPVLRRRPIFAQNSYIRFSDIWYEYTVSVRQIYVLLIQTLSHFFFLLVHKYVLGFILY